MVAWPVIEPATRNVVATVNELCEIVSSVME
jgi:hypothetical protein